MTLEAVVQVPSGGRNIRLWRAVVLLAERPADPREGSRAAGARADQAEACVFEFDEAYTAFVEGFEGLPSEAQMLALQAVDTHVASMVAMKDASLWSEAARRGDAKWLDLRELASRVLVEFDWPDRVE